MEINHGKQNYFVWLASLYVSLWLLHRCSFPDISLFLPGMVLTLGTYIPIAFDERVTVWLQPPGHCLVHVRLLHCMHVQLRNGYTRAYAQIMQHTHTPKALTLKSYSLVAGNQSIVL